MSFNYDNVPSSVLHAAEAELNRIGYSLEYIRHSSNHPDDKHLFNIVASRLDSDDNLRFVKWRFNSQTCSLNHGHYQITKEQALQLVLEHTHDASDMIPRAALRANYRNNDVVETILHEMGHEFDSPKWSFEVEAMTMFYTYYLVQSNNWTIGRCKHC